MEHCYGAWYCPVAPSSVTDTGIQLLKSHTVLHISQQSLTLDSHLQSLIFLSSVQVKASFDPSDGNRDQLTLHCPLEWTCACLSWFCLLGGAP